MFQAADTQGKLFGGYNRLLDWVGNDTFYAHLGREGRSIFTDEQFRGLYCEDNGRPCVPPSTLAIALLLQMHDKCSDEEAVDRCKFDERWKVALDLGEREKPFAKSTFQEFRAKLNLNEKYEKLFLRLTVSRAVQQGLVKSSTIKAVLDTTPILGRGAVKDTFNLVADGIKILCQALSAATGEELEALARRLDLNRYIDETVSLKGGAQIDWTNGAERRLFLNSLVTDSQRLLLEATRIREQLPEEKREPIAQAEVLLLKLVTQDTEPDPKDPTKVRIKKGTAKDRSPSAHDPEMRHGRKSASKRFDGHKLAVAAEPETGLVTALEVLPGNAPDSQGALELVNETEANVGRPVEMAIGYCAYGGGLIRQGFVDEQRTLVAKVPAPPSDDPFHKAHFDIDLEEDKVTCPAGHTTTDFKLVTSDSGDKVKRFTFPPPLCQGCPHRGQCVHTKDETQGRTVTLHPQEPLLQQARQYQSEPQFQEDMKKRQRAEHVQARLVQLGARQARYFGKAKTLLQMVIIAAVLNLTVIFKHSAAAAEATTAASSSEESSDNDWPGADAASSPTERAADSAQLNQQGYNLTTNRTRGSPCAPTGSTRGDP